MLNQTLKNQIVPWQEKGRWYRVFVESDGSHIKLTECDLEGCAMSGNNLTLPAGYSIIDVKYTDVDLAASKTIGIYGKEVTSGYKDYLRVPSAADFTYCEVWFFAYFKEV